MSRILIAVVLSLLLHGLLALSLVIYLRDVSCDVDEPAMLDLSSVELSFAEQEDDSAAVAPAMPSVANPEPPKPKDQGPPRDHDIAIPPPPDPQASRFPEPKEEQPEMVTPDPPQVESQPMPAEAPRQARIEAPPKPKRAIRPEYPEGAKQRGEQGEVTLEIVVDASGNVGKVDVVVSSGFSELDSAAVKAVRKARFSPAKSDGKVVQSMARLKLVFKLK